MKYYQHGDVILVPTNNLPDIAKPIKEMKDVVQWGEVTNHAHRLYGDGFTILETPEKKRYLKLIKTTALRHEEHAKIDLPSGDYEVRIVREKNHFDDLVAPVVD